MKGLGEKIEESILVQKILRSLLDKFNPKVSAIEELNDLKTLSIDQLLVTLTAYEMRINKDKSITREASFKEDKDTDSDLDDIEAKFVRRLKKGLGKYQGKLPLKCFNCGNIGHFANKCPHKKKERNFEGEEKYKYKRFDRNKSLCVNNDDSSKDTDSDSSYYDKVNEFMLMAKEDYDNKNIGSDDNDEEAVVELEGELISALEEIDRLGIKNRKQKQLLIQFKKDSKQPDEEFSLLKVELKEAKKIEDFLKQQLLGKKTSCKALEEEVLKTRKELEKFQALYHQNLSSIKASEGLATILNQQRNPKLKTGLGYEEGSSSGHLGNKDFNKFVKSTTNDDNKLAEIKEDNQPPRRSKEKGARTEFAEQGSNTLPSQGNHQHGRNRFSQRRRPFSRYKEFFYGYCFYYSNFGHKVVNCSLRLRHKQLRFPRNKYLPQQGMRHPSKKLPQIANHLMAQKRTQFKHNNHFDSLINEPEFYIYHNYGHKVVDCRLKKYKSDLNSSFENFKVWKKKESDKCGNVILENDEPGKNKDKGVVSLSNGKGDSQDDLPIDGMKHNLLNVSQMHDRGCKEVVLSKYCKIKSINSRQVVGKNIRTNNNVDVESYPASKEED
jgi:hypothetical protein